MKAKKAGRSGAPAGPAPGPVNPWETAAHELRAQQNAPAAAGAQAGQSAQSAAPWTTVEERSGTAFVRRLGRGLLWTMVGLLTLLGAKALLFPKKPVVVAAPSAPSQTAPAYPVEDAQAVAARYARAYLSWDEKDAASRAAQLAAVLPEGADATAGWNGKGQQDVVTVEPGSVTVAGQQARVRVDVLVRAASSSAAPPAPGGQPATATPATSAARWIGLDVPVVQAGGRIVVSGAPGIVGVPAAGPKAPELAAPESDAEFSKQTAETVSKFFKAYSGGGDTESVTAPGAWVPPLPPGFTLVGVTSWNVDKGSGADRTGTARVAWQTSGAQLEQTYRIRLTRVTSSDAERWQVASLHGGTA
ncbi:conjugal transfer protein [Streptomyces subrutilus]|uniref:conjugal transfer protein n=1 Tax=Streptomyces subrutilus TaxID=36818 RepID=UPI0033E3E77C